MSANERLKAGKATVSTASARLASRFGKSAAIEPLLPEETVVAHTGTDNPAAIAKLRDADPLDDQTTRFPGLAIDPDAIVLGSLLVAGTIGRLTTDDERRERMRRVIDAKLTHLRTALDLNKLGPVGMLADLCEGWTPAQKTTLLIELVGIDPFHPHQLSWENAHRNSGLAAVAELIGLQVDDASRVLSTFADAARAHRDISLLRVGIYSAAGAAIVGTAGLLAAPIIGATLGGAAGLSGAAATSHGLALIGGITGSSSVTAGTWLIAQTGAVAGAIGSGGGSALYGLGAAKTQAELIKLQVAAKLVLVDLQRNDAAAHQIAQELKQQLGLLEERITDARLLNDPGSALLRDLERKAQALDDAGRWVDGHCGDDDGGVNLDLRQAATTLDALESALSNHDAVGVLPPDERAAIEADITVSFRVHSELDRWDVIAGVAIGLTAAVIDAFAVSTPNLSPVTTQLRSLATSSDNWLSKLSKVPFDQSIGEGFTPQNHRVLTPGHDPLLGLVWGTWDILGSTMTRTDGAGAVTVVDRLGVPSDGLAATASALVTEFAHLLSDVITPAGLPLPGWAALTLHEGGAEAAVTAYTRGYDTWHAPAMTLPVATISVMSRAYRAMRSEHDASFANAANTGADSARMRSIELIAYGVAAAADVSQLAAGASPLTANYVQWLTLARRVAAEANERATSVNDTLVADLSANQLVLNRGWDLLLARSA